VSSLEVKVTWPKFGNSDTSSSPPPRHVLVGHHGQVIRSWDYIQGTPACRVNISVGMDSASYQVEVVRDCLLTESFPDSPFGVYDIQDREKTIILTFLRQKIDEIRSNNYENGQHFREVIYD